MMNHAQMIEKINTGEISVRDQLWIADFRYKNILEKPIRHIAPTLVVLYHNDDLPANKYVYYSHFHFREVGKTGKITNRVISPFDNLARHNGMMSVGIFLTQQEAISYYAQQCLDVQRAAANAKDDWILRFDAIIFDSVIKRDNIMR